jgi:DNA gyrase inhibitor GyrI
METDKQSSNLQVRIVRLESLRVASVLGFGKQPEEIAWQKLETWAKPRGYLEQPEIYRIFGFNNPSPSHGSPNYGYEFWLTLPPQVEPEGEVEIKRFAGGLYAVAHWDGQGDPNVTIPAAWEKLVRWRENSRYHAADHQWLEEHLIPEGSQPGTFELDLYLPIAE